MAKAENCSGARGFCAPLKPASVWSVRSAAIFEVCLFRSPSQGLVSTRFGQVIPETSIIRCCLTVRRGLRRFGWRTACPASWPLLGSAPGVGGGVQERLEDQDCGHLIDQQLVLLTALAGGVKNLMRGAAGQALVPQMDRQAGQLAQFCGEGPGLLGLRADLAGFTCSEMERVADDDASAAEAAAEPGQGAHVVTRVALAGERQDRLRREAQLVGDGHTDSLGADVKGQIAIGTVRNFLYWYSYFQWSTPGSGYEGNQKSGSCVQLKAFMLPERPNYNLRIGNCLHLSQRDGIQSKS
jgi:hypothetical protein